MTEKEAAAPIDLTSTEINALYTSLQNAQIQGKDAKAVVVIFNKLEAGSTALNEDK